MEDNWIALAIAILAKPYLTPEMAFEVLEGKEISAHGRQPMNVEDIEDMMKLREQGCTYAEIGAMYGMTESGVHYRIKRCKRRKTA